MDRKGEVFDALQAVLHLFSLDIVRVIHSYCVFPFPTRGKGSIATLLTFWDEVRQPSPVYAIACAPDRTIWTIRHKTLFPPATTHQIRYLAIYDENFGFLREISKKSLENAVSIAFAPDGCAYLPDGSHMVCYSPSGASETEFRTSTNCVAVDRKTGHLFTTDGYNTVHVFDDNGILLRSWNCGTVATSRFGTVVCIPTAMAVDAEGNVAITNTHGDHIRVYDTHGKFIREFGGYGSSIGELKIPCSIAVDRGNNWLVCDRDNQRVQIFSADGQPILCFMTSMSGTEPSCICVDFEGRMIVGNYDGSVGVYAVTNSD